MTQQQPLAMPLEEAMRTQRAIRRIKSDTVDDSLVLHLLELAMKAPTGSNAQNWEFIVVKDREVVAKLARLNRRAMNLVSPIYTRSFERRGDEKMLRLYKAVQMAGGSLRRDPRRRCGMPQGGHGTLAVDSYKQRLRFYLSGGAKLLAGGTCRRVGRGTDHRAAVEQAAGEARAGPAVECHSVCGNPSWLADRQIRSHDTSSGRRARLAGPIRQSSVSLGSGRCPAPPEPFNQRAKG